MTGTEHYRKAEMLLRSDPDPDSGEDMAALLARAQVHATLALAAASALSNITEGGLPSADRTEWIAAASEHPVQQKRFREAEAAKLANNG